MERITIQINDRQKARKLVDFLRTLDFVEKVSSTDLSRSDKVTSKEAKDFFALAGLWAERDVTLKSIPEKAWPYRS